MQCCAIQQGTDLCVVSQIVAVEFPYCVQCSAIQQGTDLCVASQIVAVEVPYCAVVLSNRVLTCVLFRRTKLNIL